MFLKKEISDLYAVFQSGLALRRTKQVAGENAPVWLPVMSLIVVFVVAVALMLLSFDGRISRAAVAAHILPKNVLKIMTNLVLAAPYIALFSVVIIVALMLRQRLRQAGRFNALYQRWGIIAGNSLFAILAILSAGLIVNIVKYIIGRPRPILIDVVGPYALKPFDFTYAYVSFPSGHACTAGVLATLIALWFPRCRIAAYVVFALIASMRVFVQAHYPTDVLLGFLTGAIITLVLARFFAQAGLLFHLQGTKLFPQVNS